MSSQVIQYDSDNGVWQMLGFDENATAEVIYCHLLNFFHHLTHKKFKTPLDDEYESTYPLGSALSLTSTERVDSSKV